MPPAVPERPNLLVIVSDQHSPHVLGCAGDSVVRTPHLDRLAARGTHFSSAYCAAPLCVPSRMAFMTSQHPSAIQVWSNRDVLGSDVPTFAHALGVAGYETVLCGRMHFIGPDQRHGFERRILMDIGGGYFGLGGPGPDFGPHIPAHTAGMQYPGVQFAGPGRTSYQAYDADVTTTAVDYLRTRKQSGDPRPFCLVVGFLLPHSPYICPRPLYDEYAANVSAPSVPEDYLDRLHLAMRAWREDRGVDHLSMAEAQRARAAYYGLVTLLDEQVGRVLAALEEGGHAADTAVVYTSDHGEMAGEHGMWWKMSFYQGSAGVPLIWSWPGRIAQGHTTSAAASLLDVAPTLLELGSAPTLPNGTGHSLLGLLKGEVVPDWPDEAFYEMLPSAHVPAARMVRRGPWKLSYFHGYDTPQLFHLEEDPQELDDRGADPACRDVREALLARVHAGWSAAANAAIIERRTPDVALLTQWFRAVRPNYTRWVPRPEQNLFPEP